MGAEKLQNEALDESEIRENGVLGALGRFWGSLARFGGNDGKRSMALAIGDWSFSSVS